MSGEKQQATRISVGDIENSSGVAIGDNNIVRIESSAPLALSGLAPALEDFLKLLDLHKDSVGDAADVRESAIAVKSEIGKPSPRLAIVRTLLAGIKASVAGVATLTEAISNIQVLLSHAK
ncbi:MAG TPA: hypothetical protein VMC83_41620 [Streptosporangiaceae bacterium]|nr:hypothetical protein [Streptosporangiaceae bacterium]